MVGRPRTPTPIKRLKGTLQPCRTNHAEPVPTAPLDRIPDAVVAFPRALSWWEIVRADGPPGMLKSIDAAMLEGFCLSVGYAEESAIELQKSGLFLTDDKGRPYENPAVGTLKKMLDSATRAAAHLGLTPASRSRIHSLGTPEPQQEDESVERWKNVLPMVRQKKLPPPGGEPQPTARRTRKKPAPGTTLDTSDE